MAEPPSAGDRHHRVNGGVGGLQIAVRTIQPHAAQILQRRGAEMATEHVLNGARGDADRRGNIAQPDILVSVLVNELDCPAQRAGLRRSRFDSALALARRYTRRPSSQTAPRPISALTRFAP